MHVKRACGSQTTVDIEEAMGEGEGDDDKEANLRTKMRVWRGLDLQATDGGHADCKKIMNMPNGGTQVVQTHLVVQTHYSITLR